MLAFYRRVIYFASLVQNDNCCKKSDIDREYTTTKSRTLLADNTVTNDVEENPEDDVLSSVYVLRVDVSILLSKPNCVSPWV